MELASPNITTRAKNQTRAWDTCADNKRAGVIGTMRSTASSASAVAWGSHFSVRAGRFPPPSDTDPSPLGAAPRSSWRQYQSSQGVAWLASTVQARHLEGDFRREPDRRKQETSTLRESCPTASCQCGRSNRRGSTRFLQREEEPSSVFWRRPLCASKHSCSKASWPRNRMMKTKLQRPPVRLSSGARTMNATVQWQDILLPKCVAFGQLRAVDRVSFAPSRLACAAPLQARPSSPAKKRNASFFHVSPLIVQA